MKRKKYADGNRRGLFKVPLQNIPKESEKIRKNISQ
jgi:hypothetical protein